MLYLYRVQMQNMRKADRGFADFFRHFVKKFNNQGDKYMKCNNCGKKLDEVDCACKWCTFCGTIFDVKAVAPPEKQG